MYDVINEIINHTWIQQGANEQQYVYMIVGVIICLLTVTSIDLLYRVFNSIFKGRR